MKKLDERKKGFEGKFARDQELEFKILARRNKYLGVWAAEKLRLSGPAVEEYFAEVIKSDLEEDGDMDVFRKVRKDFDEKGISITDDELRQSMDQFLLQAKEEIIGKVNILLLHSTCTLNMQPQKSLQKRKWLKREQLQKLQKKEICN